MLVRTTFARLRRAAVAWGLVFGATAAASALSYSRSFPTAAARHQVAMTTGKDVGLAILFGPIARIDTVGGYTAYKSFVFLTTIGAVWALLAATRLLRGEEDAGRWQLVLAGATDARRATGATLLALGGAVAVVLVETVLLVAVAGRGPHLRLGLGSACVFGLSIAVVPAVFACLGALTSQLGRTRRAANLLGMSLCGLAFVVRMVADSGPGLHWLRWVTPFGWSERMEPFTGDSLLPLVPAAVAVGVLAGLAVLLAGRRDVGDGVLATGEVRSPRTYGLRSTLGLLARLQLPSLASWWVGTLLAAGVFGLISQALAGSVPESVRTTLGRFGVRGAVVHQFLGVGFLFLATLVALTTVSGLAAAAEDEATGRLTHLLAQPVARSRLLAERIVLGVGAVLLGGLLAGAGVWLGAASRHVGLSLSTALGAGLNLVPTALVVLGTGAVALAIRPRLAVPAVYGLVIGSLVVDLLASMLSPLGWLARLSLVHYLALAPAAHASAAHQAVTLAVAAGLLGAAPWLFARRDS